jgi:plastocyanin
MKNLRSISTLRRARRLAALALTLALAAGLASTLPKAGAAESAPRAVLIDKFAYAPKEITVEPGTKVRWTNKDETPHTVTSQAAKKVFASAAMDTDDQYEFTFANEGDFAYFCTVHPMMTGVVHVRKGGAKSS